MRVAASPSFVVFYACSSRAGRATKGMAIERHIILLVFFFSPALKGGKKPGF